MQLTVAWEVYVVLKELEKWVVNESMSPSDFTNKLSMLMALIRASVKPFLSEQRYNLVEAYTFGLPTKQILRRGTWVKAITLHDFTDFIMERLLL